jgi:hypothetical protein
MTVPRLQNVISTNFLSMVDSGDPLAVMQAMEAAVSNELCGSAVTFSETAKNQMAELDKLNHSPIQTELTNLTKFLSPSGTLVMVKADNDTSVAMDPSTNTDLQTELASLGFSLKTDDRFLLQSTTYDKNGNQLSHADAHLGTEAEMTALSSGVKQTVSGFGVDLVTSTVTAANGDKTQYSYTLGFTRAVASIADINSLKTAIEARRQMLFGAVTAENLKVQAFSDHILERVKDGQSLFDGRRKGEFKSAEKVQETRLKDIDQKINKDVLDAIHIKQNDMKQSEVGQNTAAESRHGD